MPSRRGHRIECRVLASRKGRYDVRYLRDIFRRCQRDAFWDDRYRRHRPGSVTGLDAVYKSADNSQPAEFRPQKLFAFELRRWEAQLEPSARISAGCLRWQELPRFSADAP